MDSGTPVPCLGAPLEDAGRHTCLSLLPDASPTPCLEAPLEDAGPSPCLDFDPDAG
jgi:hypothetical protein